MNEAKQPTAILLSTQYLPPVSTFAVMQSFSEVMIEAYEPFQKSTWSNRCRIMGANGPILLSIPIEGGRGVRKLVKDVRIDFSEPWQRLHWKSIFSAYGKSSFFIFYEDKLRPFYEKKFEFLVDFNCALLEVCCQILEMKNKMTKTEKQIVDHSQNIIDARHKEFSSENFPYYHQVFDARHGFVPDLSIIDLLFNAGPEAKSLLTVKV